MTLRKNHYPELTKTQVISSNKLIQHALAALPLSALNTHKGNFGSVPIVGGDTGMVGAV